MTWIAVWQFIKRIPPSVYIIFGILLAAWLYGNHRYNEGSNDERAVWGARVAAAEKQARQAERKAQAEYDTGRDERQADTDDLRKRADAAPDGGEAGPKVKAVLEGLRQPS